MWSLSTFGAGGPVLIVLAALSVLSLAVIVMKVLQLRPVKSGGALRDAALTSWAEGDRAGAMASLASGTSPADRVLHHAMTALDKGRKGPALIAVLTARGNAEFTAMSTWLRFLELVAMIGPLLGLLGTVTGMIQSFQELAAAEGAANASVLAGGIWEALLTTAAGLLVAIPAAIGASLLASRAESAAQLIEASITELMLIEDARSR